MKKNDEKLLKVHDAIKRVTAKKKKIKTCFRDTLKKTNSPKPHSMSTYQR